MLLRRFVGLLILAFLVASQVMAAAQGGFDAEKDRKYLQGKWEVVSMLHDGKEVPGLKDPKEGKMIFTFDGDKVTVKLGDKIMNEGICKLDTGKSPKTIDIKDKRDTILGIYELRDGKVVLCMGVRGSKERPQDFTAKVGTEQSVVTLARAKK